jgi:hypothetical protein
LAKALIEVLLRFLLAPIAIGVYIDENENGKLDTNFFGIPKEQYGFSNNTKAFGIPKFEAAAFAIDTYIKSSNRLITMSIIYTHAFFALSAIPVGMYIFFTKKGTKQHRLIGRIWVSLMLIIAFSALLLLHL